VIVVRIEESDVYIKGHAMYAPHGQDIVCASVSAVVYFMCEVLHYDAVKIMEKGNVHLKVCRADIRDAFRRFISDVAEQYPEHLKLEEK
jgi:uncharacterized protein YsxB (DUF464 family)